MGMSRRSFIKHTWINLAGLALSACQQINSNVSIASENPTSSPTAEATATSTPRPSPTIAPSPTATFHPSQFPGLITPQEAEFLASHEVRMGDTSRPVIMMTYDDNGTYNEVRTILDAYKAFNMKATFFFIGEKIPLSSKAVHAIVDEGHLLECHGYAHQDFMRLTDDQINRRIEKTFKAMEEVVPGYRMRFIRLPYGSGVGSERILRVVAQWGLQHIFWSMGSNGTIPDSHDTVIRNAENGAIVLSHMYRYYDVTQAHQIVESLVDAGYALETVETGRAPSDVYQL
jgi:peptidoglycan/xylan/chitin deacetylase (PgdA/CDA1 family)